jgi:tetratricopeptide (TPR) repeat protein
MSKQGLIVGSTSVLASRILAALSLVVTLSLSQAAARGPAESAACEDSPVAKKLIEEASDPAGSYTDRRHAFEQAQRLCPNNPQLYNALVVLLLKHGAIGDALDWINRGLRVAPENADLRFSLGVALESAGRAAEALEVLGKLPPDAKTEFYIGMAHRRLGNHETARRALLKAFTSGYQDPYVLYAVIEQDRDLGDEKAGLEHFQLLDQRFPNSPWLHLLLGDAYLTRNQDVEAEGEYREALKQGPSVPVVHSKLGFLEFTRANYTEAADFFKQEIALDPEFAESYLYLGLCLRRLEKNAEAIPAFEHAIARDPNTLNAYRQLVAALIQEGRLQDALPVSEKGVKRFPDDEALWAQLAQVLQRLGRTTEGMKAAERAHQLLEQSGATPTVPAQDRTAKIAGAFSNVTPVAEPGTEGSSSTSGNIASVDAERLALGQARHCVERGDAACADTVLTEVPDGPLRRTPEFLELEAEVLRLKQNYKEALAATNQAIEADPRQPRDLALRGELYQKLGDQVSAIQSFVEAQKLGDSSPGTVYSIGLSFFALGYHDDLQEYYDRAAQHFRVALQVDPQFSKAEFMLGVIDAVRSALPEAKRHLEKALQLSPENPYYGLHYGVVLRRLGENAEALEQFEKASKLMASSAPAHFNLGRMYASLGRYAEARAELETALKIDPHLSAAYYTLGGVYRHLGLDEMSKKAWESFKGAAQQNTQVDPVEAVISQPEPATGAQVP